MAEHYDIIDGRRVPPTVVDTDRPMSGTHNGTLIVRNGAHLELTGTLRGSLAIEEGSAAIRGTVQGSLHVGPGSRAVIQHRQQGSVHISASGQVVVETRGRLAGSLHNDGQLILRGEFGGTRSGRGELVLEGGRVVAPRRSGDGAFVYEWRD